MPIWSLSAVHSEPVGIHRMFPVKVVITHSFINEVDATQWAHVRAEHEGTTW